MTTLLLAAVVLFLACSNGANDNFKGVATIYGSGIATYRTALTWATFTTLAGSIASVFIAKALLDKFSGKGLVPDAAAMSDYFLLAVIVGASVTVMLATRLGFPISTTHALLGGLIGAGCIAVGPAGINFGSLGRSFVLPLLLSPVMALALGASLTGLFYFCHRPLRRFGEWCLCLVPGSSRRIAAVGNRGAALVGFSPSVAGLASTLPCASSAGRCESDGPCVEFCTEPDPAAVVSIRASRSVDVAHFISAGAVSFARGLNDTSKIAAPLLSLAAISPASRITLVAVAIAVGGLLGARRVAETMSHKITRMTSADGFASNLTTSALVIMASFFGLPVSTTHVSVGSLLGVGVVTGGAKPRTVVGILLSWVITLPCAACIGAFAYAATELLR